jgi:hypothetical protein
LGNGYHAALTNANKADGAGIAKTACERIPARPPHKNDCNLIDKFNSNNFVLIFHMMGYSQIMLVSADTDDPTPFFTIAARFRLRPGQPQLHENSETIIKRRRFRINRFNREVANGNQF